MRALPFSRLHGLSANKDEERSYAIVVLSSMAPTLEALWKLVSSIPYGRCSGYGDVGKALPNPVSGYLVGRWMRQCPPNVPWWRVVGKDGSLLIGKLDPEAALIQRRHLESEGVAFVDDRVEMKVHGYIPLDV